MTFMTHAHTATDPTQPLEARFVALRRCVEHSPFGFTATIDHLAAGVGVKRGRWTSEQSHPKSVVIVRRCHASARTTSPRC